MRTFILIALLFGSFSWAAAQGSGEIWGRVVDSKSGESIPGANVVIKTGNSLLGTQTDADGYYRLKNLAPGTYNLELSYVGYGTGTLEEITVYADGIVKTDDFELIPGVLLSETVIYAEKVIGTTAVPKMPQKELKTIAGKQDLAKIISIMSADVNKSEDGELYFRGSRSGDFVYYVDGIKTNAEHFKIPSTSIGSIQVYTGGVPARYGDFTGGCVVIETQSYFDWLSSRN